MILFVFCSTHLLAADAVKKPAKPVVTKVANAKTAEAPCAESAEEVMKKLEEKKKADAKKGLGLSLQGSNTEGCSVK